MLQSTTRVRKGPASCAIPDIRDYERRKRVVVARGRHGPVSTRGRVRDFESLFALRLKAVTQGGVVPPVYPGRFIPSFGSSSSTCDRGDSFFAQFQLSRAQTAGWFDRHLSASQLEGPKLWLWPQIAAPALVEVSAAGASAAHEEKVDFTLDCVLASALAAIRSRSPENLLLALNQVRRSWDADAVEESTISKLYPTVQQMFESIGHSRDRHSVLAAAYEIDAFLSFAGMQGARPAMFAQWFDGNFVTVLSKPLTDLRLTERCENERLFDELLNLVNPRFAPVLVNEYGTVADGNHRITACWIFNALRYCRHERWDLSDTGFTESMREFISSSAALSAPQLSEMLQHLQVFLTDKSMRRRLIELIQPAAHRFCDITNIPVVPLPEYLSGAVRKWEYDSGKRIIRCHHNIYRFMKQSTSAVLKPRASYHFTDAVLLPWFSILSRSTMRSE